jgi:hypothetical protein
LLHEIYPRRKILVTNLKNISTPLKKKYVQYTLTHYWIERNKKGQAKSE